MGVQYVDVGRGNLSGGKAAFETFSLTYIQRQNRIGGIGVHAVSGNLPVDFGAALNGVLQALQSIQTAAFGNDNTIAVHIIRTAGFGRIGMSGQRTLAPETGEDAESVRAFGDAAGDSHIDFAEHKLLRALDNPAVAGGAGGADADVRAGDFHVNRHFPCRIVRH